MKLPRMKLAGAVTLAMCIGLAPIALGQPFPPGPADDVMNPTTAVFKVTLSPAYGGATHVVWASGPACVGRSAVHAQGADPAGVMGVGACGPGLVGAGTTDAAIAALGPFPPGYNMGGGADEIHTEMLDMVLTAGNGFVVAAGPLAAPMQPKRSLGEVESRVGAGGYPADTFFNLHVEVTVPPAAGGPLTLINHTPLTIEANGIMALPPWGAEYLHSFTITGKVALFDTATGCFAGWLEQGNHSVGQGTVPSLHHMQLETPVVFSVEVSAEGLLQPDPCHPGPNDVFTLGMAGGHGYPTEGELFQASGAVLGARPDNTNIDRLSASLGISPFGPGPPFMGPFAPPPAAPPFPPPPMGGVGTLALLAGDNINALSFGLDGGDTLLFSVDPTAMGMPGTAVEFEAMLSPFIGLCINGPGGGFPSGSIGGDPGDEAAGDVFIGPQGGFWGGGAPLGGLMPAPFGMNALVFDELQLGLQGAALTCSAIGPPEDDLDALEADTADRVDPNRNGMLDAGEGFIFFSVAPFGPTGLPPEDIWVSPPGGGFMPYLPGFMIGLFPGIDNLDALAVWDTGPVGFGGPNGIWDPGDTILFSVAAGSPFGPPGDVFIYSFAAPPIPVVYAAAPALGLFPFDELNALDIGWANCCCECNPSEHEWCVDSDYDGVMDPCDNCPDVPNPIDWNYGEQLDSDGDGVGDECDPCPHDYADDCIGGPIPTVSEWGMVALTVLIIVGAGVVMKRRRVATS